MRSPRSTSQPATSSEELARRASAGEAPAFTVLYGRHADEVYGLLTRLVGPVAEREDLLQDVFVRFHRALPRFRGDALVSTFLYRITVRVAHDHLRWRYRQRRIARATVDEASLEVPWDTGCAEQRRQVAEALALLGQLPPKQRIALVLREAMELSFPEIGALVGCTAATARMRVAAASRAMRRLAAAKERSR